jgi:conjugative transfer region protein TrbK
MRWLSFQTLAKVGLAILTVLVLAIDFHEEGAIKRPVAQPTHFTTDLQAELQRCQLLGKATLDDAACAKVWAENRRRFFGSEFGVSAKANPPFKNEQRAP